MNDVHRPARNGLRKKWGLNALDAVRALPRSALLLVSARAVSSLGTVLTGFALSIWIYEELGSYSMFAVVAVLNALPGLIVSPIAGVIADRYPRKIIIQGCDVLSAASVLTISIFGFFDALSPLVVGGVCLFLALMRTISWPASQASIAALVSEEHRPRVNGIAEFFEGSISILGPVLGAALYKIVGLSGVTTVDVLSYVCSVAIISMLAFPSIETPRAIQKVAGSAYSRLLSDAASGFHWIARHKDLKALLFFFAIVNIGCSVFTVVYTPYVLSFLSAKQLGVCLMLEGVGVVIGGAAFATTGGFRTPMIGVLLGSGLLGLSMTVFGLTRSIALLYCMAFVYGASFPLMNASSQTIWQSRVPLDMQGRVFSIRRMIAWGLTPLSILLSVPIVEALLTPLLSSDSLLDKLWGQGTVGALGFMASLCGVLCVLMASAVAGLRITGNSAPSR